MSQATTVKERIFAYLDYCKNSLDTAIISGCPVFNLAVEAGDNNPAVKQKVAAALLDCQATSTASLPEGIVQEEFEASLYAGDFAFKMFSAAEGATVICRVLDSSQLTHQLVKALRNGLEGYTGAGFFNQLPICFTARFLLRNTP